MKKHGMRTQSSGSSHRKRMGHPSFSWAREGRPDELQDIFNIIRGIVSANKEWDSWIRW